MTTSMTTADKLVYMANQISDFFAAQGEARAVPAIADHIRKFWPPKMRADLAALSSGEAEKLKPLARKAVALLSAAERPAT
jgi:formate dehydrogenase subunit delta